MRRQFLYELRNNFTHAAHSPMTVARMVDSSRIVVIDATGHELVVKRAARMVEGRVDKKGAFFVNDWPYVLYRTVARAVGEPVPDFDARYTLVIQFSEDKYGQLVDVKEADFNDRTRLVEMVSNMRELIMRPDPKTEEEWDVDLAVTRFDED